MNEEQENLGNEGQENLGNQEHEESNLRAPFLELALSLQNLKAGPDRIGNIIMGSCQVILHKNYLTPIVLLDTVALQLHSIIPTNMNTMVPCNFKLLFFSLSTILNEVCN